MSKYIQGGYVKHPFTGQVYKLIFDGIKLMITDGEYAWPFEPCLELGEWEVVDKPECCGEKNCDECRC